MLKKSPLRKQNPLTAKKKQAARAIEREEDEKFYLEIWNDRLHKSDLTGKYLGFEMKTIFFHHLLPKSKYPDYRHCEWNILLCEDKWHSQIETNPNLLPEELFDKLHGLTEKARIKAHLNSL